MKEIVANVAPFSRVHTVCLDLDGTISDPREGIVRSFQYALDKLGYPVAPEDQLLRYIGPPLYESFAALLHTTDSSLIERAVHLYRERFATKGMFENMLYAGIPQALRKLKTVDYQLCIVTSKPTPFARRIIAYFGLEKFFYNIYGSELDGSRADKSDLIAYVLEREQIIPTSAVMVGDREHDIKGALANGVRAIGVLWGYGSGDELTRADASFLCETPESLLAHLCN
jgi:phosphoglycolate phosphatase